MKSRIWLSLTGTLSRRFRIACVLARAVGRVRVERNADAPDSLFILERLTDEADRTCAFRLDRHRDVTVNRSTSSTALPTIYRSTSPE